MIDLEVVGQQQRVAREELRVADHREPAAHPGHELRVLTAKRGGDRVVRLACPATQAFSQTETCFVLSLVNGSRFQPLQRSRSVIPVTRAIRSSSDGQT